MKLRPYKAPGPSGIPNAILTHCRELLVPHLGPIYRATFTLATYPAEWKTTATIALRKPGKPDYSLAKVYRPIALGESLAKVLSACIAETLVHHSTRLRLLPDTHFGGLPGRSTTDSLHLVVKFIKDAWRRNEVVSALFLDVKGAFPSVSVKRLIYDLRKKGIPEEYTGWLERKLTGRRTTIGFDDFISAPFEVNDGCDQGCPLSVILYLLYNTGLIEVANTAAKELAPGFIDDIIFLAAGPDLEHTHRKITDMMERPGGGNQWSISHSSLFEPDKLRLVDFTRKREASKHPGPRTVPLTRPALTLGTQTIHPAQSYKYLGVILDQELRFKEHVAYTLAKGTAWVTQFRRLSRPTVGMPSRFARQLFKAIAVPRMLYAADIFLTPVDSRPEHGRTSGSVGHIAKLARVQRTAAIHATGAMRTTATDVLDAHADLLPFHILINQICHRSALRLATLPDTHLLHKHMRKARRYVKWHRSPLHELQHRFRIDPEALESIATHRQAPGWTRQVEVKKAASKEVAYKEGMESRAQIRVYTDRSDIGGGVGASAVLYRDGQRQGTLRSHLGLSTLHTIYEVELAGILLATHQLKKESSWM